MVARSHSNALHSNKEIKVDEPPLNACAPRPGAEGEEQQEKSSTASTSAWKSLTPVDIPNHYYKSQQGEDELLMGWFRNLCGGTYLEMGGLDGVLYSNSYVFNRALDWKGVLVELMSFNYEKLVANRPDEIARLNAGVCDESQTLHYYGTEEHSGAIGGIYEFSSPAFREMFWEDVALDDPRVKEIRCDTLDSLLLENAPGTTFFDFFSLDVEGGELSVLRSIDFDRVSFGVIFFEVRGSQVLESMVARLFLESKGYTFLFENQGSYWFANSNFHEIYKDLA